MLWLSIVVINEGAAWASQNCLARGESPYHAHISSGSDLEHDHRADARIHCLKSNILNLAFGPASFGFRLEPSKDGAGGWLNTGPISLNALLVFLADAQIYRSEVQLAKLNRLRVASQRFPRVALREVQRRRRDE
jgi:hypothetical protein